MHNYEDFPTCNLCRSIDLEVVHNDDFGPMITCGQCGYNWIASFEDITPEITITRAS